MEKNNKILKRTLLSIISIIIVAIITFVIYEVATVHNTYYRSEKTLQIPIFVYHDLVEDESQIEFDYMQTTAKRFEEQITGLMNLGYVPISYQDLVDYYNGELSAFRIAKKKLVTKIGGYQFSGKGTVPVKQALPYPTFVDYLPDQDKIIVCAMGLDKLCLFDVQDDGTIVYDNVHSFDVKPGNGPKKVIFNESGNRAYVLNAINSTIDVYQYENLKFELLQTVDTYPKDDEYDNEPTDLKFNFDQTHLYVTNKGHDSLALFDVEEDGTLTYLDFEDTSPDPVDVLVYNEEGNEWTVVACQKGGIIESYQYRKEKGGMVVETKFSCMVNEPVKLTPFVNKF